MDFYPVSYHSHSCLITVHRVNPLVLHIKILKEGRHILHHLLNRRQFEHLQQKLIL